MLKRINESNTTPKNLEDLKAGEVFWYIDKYDKELRRCQLKDDFKNLNLQKKNFFKDIDQNNFVVWDPTNFVGEMMDGGIDTPVLVKACESNDNIPYCIIATDKDLLLQYWDEWFKKPIKNLDQFANINESMNRINEGIDFKKVNVANFMECLIGIWQYINKQGITLDSKGKCHGWTNQRDMFDEDTMDLVDLNFETGKEPFLFNEEDIEKEIIRTLDRMFGRGINTTDCSIINMDNGQIKVNMHITNDKWDLGFKITVIDPMVKGQYFIGAFEWNLQAVVPPTTLTIETMLSEGIYM